MGMWGAPIHVWKVVLTPCSGEAFESPPQDVQTLTVTLDSALKHPLKDAFIVSLGYPQNFH